MSDKKTGLMGGRLMAEAFKIPKGGIGGDYVGTQNGVLPSTDDGRKEDANDGVQAPVHWPDLTLKSNDWEKAVDGAIHALEPMKKTLNKLGFVKDFLASLKVLGPNDSKMERQYVKADLLDYLLKGTK